MCHEDHVLLWEKELILEQFYERIVLRNPVVVDYFWLVFESLDSLVCESTEVLEPMSCGCWIDPLRQIGLSKQRAWSRRRLVSFGLELETVHHLAAN